VPILEPSENTVLVETARHKDVFGNLYLTSKRLIFEHTTGIFSKRVYVTLDLLLEAVSNVSIEGTFPKKLVVYAKKGYISSFPVRLDFLVKEPKQWADKIASARQQRLESLDAEKKRERVQVVLDFTALKEYMAKGGLMLQTLKCPECGGPIRLPEAGSQTKCEHCGNMILAQDIFEKIRALI